MDEHDKPAAISGPSRELSSSRHTCFFRQKPPFLTRQQKLNGTLHNLLITKNRCTRHSTMELGSGCLVFGFDFASSASNLLSDRNSSFLPGRQQSHAWHAHGTRQ